MENIKDLLKSLKLGYQVLRTMCVKANLNLAACVADEHMERIDEALKKMSTTEETIGGGCGEIRINLDPTKVEPLGQILHFNVPALSFRDQCALVFMKECYPYCKTSVELSKKAFDLADAMEAERQKRMTSAEGK